MHIDIILEPDLDPGQIKELGVKAEEYGVNALWTSNYFSHWDPFLSLVPLSESTKELKFGPLAVSPFEMHPLKIANSLISLNEMSNGRAQVAVGAGEGARDKEHLLVVVQLREKDVVVHGLRLRHLVRALRARRVAVVCTAAARTNSDLASSDRVKADAAGRRGTNRCPRK